MSPRLRAALDAIRFARAYALGLIDAVDPADWFRMPPGGVTHVGWQVGHLAMAQYRLCVERVRGVRPDDAGLISPEFLALFLRDSVPDPDATRYPTPAAIRAVFDRVHECILADLADWPDADLDSPPAMTAHKLCKTKLECLRWCSAHEMLHAGQ
ncbi:MAG TPA: DinB family protein, partial [Urbifossiella sp.]|nr:DinB family protein [Urbifossiella sp.]